MKKQRIYLDCGATTPLDKDVFKAMAPYFSEKFGNAMSLHSFGQEAFEAMEKSRHIVADFFGVSDEEVVFTSGATESNNLVIKGIVRAHYLKNKNVPHIITSAFEHHCVLDACKAMEKEGLAEVTFLKPNADGLIDLKEVEKAIKKNTILISIMYVNNEIGTVQPIGEIGKLAKKNNILFHTDATQAVNYFDCNLKNISVDLLSMSAHKIYGPKGIGALIVKKGTPIKRVQDGGDQENKMRAGTHNVPGIVGLGKAIEKVKTQKSKIKNTLKLRNYLIDEVLKNVPDTRLNGSREKRSPNNANFSFKNIEGESLILMLNREGVAGSTGSACSSGSLDPSHVLLSIGLEPIEAHGSLRLTLGKYTTKQEIDLAIKAIKKVVSELRQVSGNVLDDYYQAKKK